MKKNMIYYADAGEDIAISSIDLNSTFVGYRSLASFREVWKDVDNLTTLLAQTNIIFVNGKNDENGVYIYAHDFADQDFILKYNLKKESGIKK